MPFADQAKYVAFILAYSSNSYLKGGLAWRSRMNGAGLAMAPTHDLIAPVALQPSSLH